MRYVVRPLWPPLVAKGETHGDPISKTTKVMGKTSVINLFSVIDLVGNDIQCAWIA